MLFFVLNILCLWLWFTTGRRQMKPTWLERVSLQSPPTWTSLTSSKLPRWAAPRPSPPLPFKKQTTLTNNRPVDKGPHTLKGNPSPLDQGCLMAGWTSPQSFPWPFSSPPSSWHIGNQKPFRKYNWIRPSWHDAVVCNLDERTPQYNYSICLRLVLYCIKAGFWTRSIDNSWDMFFFS